MDNLIRQMEGMSLNCCAECYGNNTCSDQRSTGQPAQGSPPDHGRVGPSSPLLEPYTSWLYYGTVEEEVEEYGPLPIPPYGSFIGAQLGLSDPSALLDQPGTYILGDLLADDDDHHHNHHHHLGVPSQQPASHPSSQEHGHIGGSGLGQASNQSAEQPSSSHSHPSSSDSQQGHAKAPVWDSCSFKDRLRKVWQADSSELAHARAVEHQQHGPTPSPPERLTPQAHALQQSTQPGPPEQSYVGASTSQRQAPYPPAQLQHASQPHLPHRSLARASTPPVQYWSPRNDFPRWGYRAVEDYSVTACPEGLMTRNVPMSLVWTLTAGRDYTNVPCHWIEDVVKAGHEGVLTIYDPSSARRQLARQVDRLSHYLETDGPQSIRDETWSYWLRACGVAAPIHHVRGDQGSLRRVAAWTPLTCHGAFSDPRWPAWRVNERKLGLSLAKHYNFLQGYVRYPFAYLDKPKYDQIRLALQKESRRKTPEDLLDRFHCLIRARCVYISEFERHFKAAKTGAEASVSTECAFYPALGPDAELDLWLVTEGILLRGAGAFDRKTDVLKNMYGFGRNELQFLFGFFGHTLLPGDEFRQETVKLIERYHMLRAMAGFDKTKDIEEQLEFYYYAIRNYKDAQNPHKKAERRRDCLREFDITQFLVDKVWSQVKTLPGKRILPMVERRKMKGVQDWHKANGNWEDLSTNERYEVLRYDENLVAKYLPELRAWLRLRGKLPSV